MGDAFFEFDIDVEQWNERFDADLQRCLVQGEELYNRRITDVQLENIGATFPTQCLLCSHHPWLRDQGAADAHRETAKHQVAVARRAAVGFRCSFLCRLHKVNNFLEYAQHMQGNMHRDLHQHLALRRPWEHCPWKLCRLCDRWTGSGSLDRHITGRRHRARVDAKVQEFLQTPRS